MSNIGIKTRLASCGLTWLHSSSVFQVGFCAGLSALCSEYPPNAKRQNVRYR